MPSTNSDAPNNSNSADALNSKTELYKGLSYPWGRTLSPTEDAPMKVANGVYWARFPMPMSLDHINIWLLEDDEGWTVVDTCLDIESSRTIWSQLFAGFMQGKPITRVICTHLHPDHVGLAGWLTRQFNCDLWMSRAEFLMCRAMASDTGREAPDVALRFYRAAGYNEEQLERYKKKFGNFGRAISPLPDSFRRLIDRETLTIGGRYWQVIVGSGHSPEHTALYCPALKLLIAGDQILPRITPNVSVFPTEPKGDPLAEWLSSSARIRDILPADLLVLPAHEAPFYGLHVRLSQIIESHEHDMNKLFDYLEHEKRAVDCFPALFSRDIDKSSLGLATGETLAHLNCLLERSSITCRHDKTGVNWYQQIPTTDNTKETRTGSYAT